MSEARQRGVRTFDADESADGDRSLMERVHADDRSALDELLRRHWAPLVAYAERLLPSRDDAEDVVQETMLRLWHTRGDWTPTERLRSFLYRITRNLAINERRRGRVRDRYRDDPANQPAARPDSPLQLLERQEIRDAFAHALDTLPPRRREVFVLGWYHGHSYREIAEIMDISPQTVANQMSSALDDLRRVLRPQLDALMTQGQLRLVRRVDGAPAPPAPEARRTPR
jgi:RNA polymerase sigma-70 factor, ECF subfamily